MAGANALPHDRGRWAKLVKDSPTHGLKIGMCVVVASSEEDQVPGKDGAEDRTRTVYKLWVVDTEADAKAVVRSILVHDGGLEDYEHSQMIAIMPRGLGPLPARSLQSIHAEYKADLLGAGKAPLRVSDIPAAVRREPAPAVHRLVGTSGKIKFIRMVNDMLVTVEADAKVHQSSVEGFLELRWKDASGASVTQTFQTEMVEGYFAQEDSGRGVIPPEEPYDIAPYRRCCIVFERLTRSANIIGEKRAFPSEIIGLAHMIDKDLVASGSSLSQEEKKRACGDAMMLIEGMLIRNAHLLGVAGTSVPEEVTGTPALARYLKGLAEPKRLNANSVPPGGLGATVDDPIDAGGGMRPPAARINLRLKALKGLAASEEEFDSCLLVAKDAILDATTAKVLASLQGAEAKSILESALDRWLGKCGVAGTVADIKGRVGGLNAMELLDTVLIIKEYEEAPNKGLHDAAPSRLQLFMPAPPDETGTAFEITERSQCMQAAKKTLESKDGKTLVEKLQSMCSAGKIADVVKAIAAAPEPVQRLFCTGTEVAKTIATRVDEAHAIAVLSIRSALDRDICVKFWGTATEGDAPERVCKALELVRIARMGKVPLMHLVDIDDTLRTKDKPLAGFAKLGDERGKLCFVRTIGLLQKAWSLSDPVNASAIIDFGTRMSNFVTDAFDQGADWSDINIWYKATMVLVDKQAERFGRAEGVEMGRRSSPKPEWCDGPHYTHVQKLYSSASHKLAAAAGASAATAVLEKDASSRKSERPSNSGQQANEIEQLRKSLASAKRANKDERKDKPAKKIKETKEEKEKKPPPVDPNAGLGEYDGKSRKAQELHLMTTVGKHDGKFPCLFFFTPGRTCKADAGTCRWHHHE